MKNNRYSILIIDDERATREAMGKFLRGEYDVTLAEDGEIGINLINRNDYDLILSDICMEPGPSGLDVLAASLKRDPAPPCILFTAYGSIETAVDAVKKGAFDFVTKPVNFDRLELIIGRALYRRTQHGHRRRHIQPQRIKIYARAIRAVHHGRPQVCQDLTPYGI